MSDTDYMTEIDRTFSMDLLSTPRPLCPKCEMRMITVHTPHPSAVYECLRCGHNEPKRA
jgi:DNA-directed RNA polymerase subunit RPC12/RpoP